MAKKRKTRESKPAPQAKSSDETTSSIDATREAIESIVVAIVLALLFRAFEAEAFVIPTGSMAPTLLGRNRDLECPECGYLFPFGDSENSGTANVFGGICPLCGAPKEIAPNNPNDRSMNGDRILVNKFAYQFWEPERWDVIVFKNPGNAKQNYIKRLIGLPGETIRVFGGDIYVRSEDGTFQIARKPPEKLDRLLRLVHDTQHVPDALPSANWPSAWQPRPGSPGWSVSKDQRSYALEKPGSDTAWLHYVHTIPDISDWTMNGSLRPDAQPTPRLIMDRSGYNTRAGVGPRLDNRHDGYHWVGDLASECTIRLAGDNGELTLQLVEGGTLFSVTIDIASGTASCRLPKAVSLAPTGGDTLTATTSIRGSGTYDLMWANIDDRLLLWVDGDLVSWETGSGTEHDGGYHYQTPPTPRWSATEPGDLHPVRVGVKGSAASILQLRVFRDMYYIAVDDRTHTNHHVPMLDYDSNTLNVRLETIPRQVDMVARSPSLWNETSLFEARRGVEFQLEEDQFFPMGDNSAVSQDARLWAAEQLSPYLGIRKSAPPYVEREELIGKAFMVYWPHAWKKFGIPVPNVKRMGTIR